MEREKSYAVYLKRGCIAVLKVEVFFKLIAFFRDRAAFGLGFYYLGSG